LGVPGVLFSSRHARYSKTIKRKRVDASKAGHSQGIRGKNVLQFLVPLLISF
jgi:hypothetical protein